MAPSQKTINERDRKSDWAPDLLDPTAYLRAFRGAGTVKQWSESPLGGGSDSTYPRRDFAGSRVCARSQSDDRCRGGPRQTHNGVAIATEVPVVEQAGGIVLWSDHLVVRRTKHGHIVLPKGQCEAGESLECTAVREVNEETGLIAIPMEKCGTLVYTKHNTIRRVTFFLMRVLQVSQDWPKHRNTDTFIIPVEQARGLLSYENTRELVRSVLPRIERLKEAPES